MTPVIVVAVALVVVGNGFRAARAEGRGAWDRVSTPNVTVAAGGHGEPAGGLGYDVTQFGYREEEYYFDGTAKTYPPVAPSTAPYRSRMIVWTPADPAKFNGTTVVEWAEVSDFGQFELTVELNAQSPMLEEQGFAFVLVSAEARGVCDRTADGCTGTSLQGADPGRYGSLSHPGDAYSFDIFSQALQAIKHPGAVAPLGKLKTRVIIAEGFQRSVDKYFPVGAPVSPDPPTGPFSIYGPLNDYLANGADDDARVADAFLIDAAAPAVEPQRYRVPTLHHLDESAVRRVPSTDRRNHVTWEIAGAPHAERWSGSHIRIPSSNAPTRKLDRPAEEARRARADNFGLEPLTAGDVCAPGPNTGSPFPRRFTLNAAVLALDRWVRTGVPAPAAPRLERTGPVPDSPTAKLARDADGNAIGGLRSPVIEVPVASYNGEACVSSGIITPFSPERLAQLYPSHASYVRPLQAATDDAVAGGFLVCQDAVTILGKASASAIGGPDAFRAEPRCARNPLRKRSLA